jgi:hydrogenase-4 component E
VSPFVAAVVCLAALVNFRLLGGSRMVPIIRAAALQGALLALVAAFLQARQLALGAALLAAASALIKGVVLPALLLRAMRQVEIRREVEPLVGYNLSLLLGAVGLGIAAATAGRLSPAGVPGGALLVGVGAFTILTGLFLMMARRKAITQALGYFVFENGIYAFGIAAAREAPLLVELGVLLDLLVAVFVMGVIIFHIQRDFSHIDVDRLALLHDLDGARDDGGAGA